MYGSPHKKSGLPGLIGTHDKNSPVQFVGAVLAGLGKAALAVGKVGAKVGMTVAKGAKAVGGAVGKAGKFVGKNVAKAEQFAKTTKGKAVIGGLYAGKKAADKQVAEVDQSIYNQKNRGGVGDFSKINFGNRV